MAINLGTIFAQIGLDTTLLRAGVTKANAQIVKADRGIGGFVKRNEKRLIGFGAAGAGAVLAVGVASIKMAGDFDQAMRNVNTITKLSEKQFLELKEEVIDLSREVPLTTAELTEGLFNVASAGVEAADQMNFLTTSSRAAVAGQANLATTVKGLTGVIKGYGDEFATADKVADLFFKTNELGVTTFEELAASMGLVVPIAASLGVTQEELFASMATLTGVTGSTSQVVTQLKAAFTNLVKPSKEAQEIAEELGISFNATSIETLGLQGFLAQLSEKTGGNVATMGKLFGSVEGLNAILALTGSSSEKFSDNLDAMADSAGAATDAFSEQQKGLNNQLKILKNNVSAIALDIGGKIIPKLTEWTTNINELDDETKDNIATTAEWSLATIGVTSAISLLLVGGRKVLAMLGPWGKAIAVVVGAATTHFKATQKLSDLIENEWLSNILASSSLIGSFTEAISVWNQATESAEKNNESIIRTLFSLRSEIEDTTTVTGGAVEETFEYVRALEAEEIASKNAAESQGDLTLSAEDAAAAIQEQADALDNLIDSLFKTFLFNADLNQTIENSEKAFNDLTEAQNEFGTESKEADEALINLALALEAAAGKIPDIINKVGFLTQEELEFLQVTKDNISAAEEFGIVEAGVWDETSAKIQDAINNKIRPSLEVMLGGLKAIDETEVDPSIKVDTTQAMKNVRSLKELISGIKSKSVTISVTRVERMIRGFEKGGVLRGFANGGTTSQRTVMVGERGPELATLPLGTRITPNNQIGQALGGGDQSEIVIPVTVNLDGEVLFQSNQRIQNKEDFRRIL